MLRSVIHGTGSWAPKKVLTNRDLEAMVETSDAWITERTGIRERRVCVDETTTEMAVKAAKAALKSSGVSPKDIDAVIVGTVTSDMVFPSTACFVQSELGIRSGASAYDVSAACSGFLYALDSADRFIRSGGGVKALVVGVDRFSGILDWKDRSTCVLFGDGAGAVVLSGEKGSRGILTSRTHSDGKRWEMLYTPSPLVNGPFGACATAREAHLKMNGNETFKVAVRTMGSVVTEALEACGLKADDVSLFIAHQANIRILNAVGERLGFSADRVYTNIDRYGNTSAGSIPLALDEAVRAGRVNEGDIVVFTAFGGGLTWGAAVVRW